MSKKSFKHLKQTHGAIISDVPSVFDVLTKEESHRISLAAQFQEKLGNMTLEELHVLAEDMGIIPIDNRDLLIKTIKKEFKKK